MNLREVLNGKMACNLKNKGSDTMGLCSGCKTLAELEPCDKCGRMYKKQKITESWKSMDMAIVLSMIITISIFTGFLGGLLV